MLTWGVQGKCIVQVFTGSVACYRAIDVLRGLRRRGARVIPAYTRSAERFVTRELLRWASGEEPFRLWNLEGKDHITLAEECDALLIDPATLDSMAAIASARASNEASLLAQSFLGMGKPVLLVPAMHEALWRRVYDEVLDKLEDIGVYILEPLVEERRAKHPPVDEVVEWVDAILARGRDYAGLRVLVTAGATREWIDDIRFISNPSSGLMGVYIAAEAADRGADVTLVHGAITVKPPRRVKSVAVDTTEEFIEALVNEAKTLMPHIVFHAAAPLDFKPAERISGKLRFQGEYSLKLVENPKASLAVKDVVPNAIHIGFTAVPSTDIDILIEEAKAKLEKHGFDLVYANPVPKVFGSRYTEGVIVYPNGLVEYIGKVHKRLLARRLLDIAVAMLARRRRA